MDAVTPRRRSCFRARRCKHLVQETNVLSRKRIGIAAHDASSGLCRSISRLQPWLADLAAQLDSLHPLKTGTFTRGAKLLVTHVQIVPCQDLPHHTVKILVTGLIGDANS